MTFRNRHEAGMRLAELVQAEDLHRPVVLALPRGGIPVAVPVANALRAPLDILVARKISAPSQAEFALGAIAEDGHPWLDQEFIQAIPAKELRRWIEAQREEVRRRAEVYRRGRTLLDLTGRDVVIVDDGIATGSTAWVACGCARQLGAGRILVATPVCARDAEERLGQCADKVLSILVPDFFLSVGQFYEDFEQVSESEALALLARSKTGALERSGPSRAAR